MAESGIHFSTLYLVTLGNSPTPHCQIEAFYDAVVCGILGSLLSWQLGARSAGNQGSGLYFQDSLGRLSKRK